MRILLVPPSDWLSHPLTSRLHFIFERLAGRHEVHVVRYPIPLWAKKRHSKAILHEVKSVPIRDLSLYYIINAPNHLLQLHNILKTCKIDVIVFANILTGAESVILGKKYQIPVICDYLDHFPESASSYYDNPVVKTLVRETVLKVTKWNLMRASHVVTVSSNFLKWLKIIGIQNVSLIPNGVELDSFKSEDRNVAREKLGIKELNNRFVITYVGSIENWVDIDLVCRATSILNNAGVPSTFQVVGGSFMGHSNTSFCGFGKNVFQTGFIDHGQVPLHINASDVCVLPLKEMAKNLTRPLKLLEYFSCGKPVLSLPNLEIECEFGDAVTFFHNAEEMARILLRIYRNPEEFSSKIKKGFKYAQENSWDNHARSYEKLLKSVVDGLDPNA
jgi:glycosyltransferase involved in cell wall biosynthesis